MTDRWAQATSGGLLVAAALVLALDPASGLRVPVILAFAVLSPGLAATRFLPELRLSDRLAISVALSLTIVTLVSLLLVAVERWNGTRAFVEIACLTGALVIMPQWRKRERRPTAQQRRTKSAIASPPPGLVAELRVRTQSPDPEVRRGALVELANVLDGQGEHEWAASLRSQAREIGRG